MEKNKLKGIYIGSGIVALIIVICGWLLFISPFGVKDTAYVCVDQDDTMDSVYNKVSEAGQTSNMMGYSLMKMIKRYSKPRTGRYAIEPGMGMFKFVRHLANGQQVPVELNVPEVRTVKEMAERLSSQLMVSADGILATLNDSVFMDSLGYSKATVPCLFVPNTYEVYWNLSAKDLVKRLDKEKNAFWTDERKQKAEAMNMTPDEVTTLASIVESETSYGPEKATVAGLYIHRMEIGMPLQSDPTVIFAIGDFNIHRVTNEQTRFQSPYNTYIHEGLTPGPIRIPSIKGIDAVLNYDHNDYVYMCAKEDLSGSHNFTSSYAEHLANAARYQKTLNEKGIMK